MNKPALNHYATAQGSLGKWSRSAGNRSSAKHRNLTPIEVEGGAVGIKIID